MIKLHVIIGKKPSTLKKYIGKFFRTLYIGNQESKGNLAKGFQVIVEEK